MTLSCFVLRDLNCVHIFFNLQLDAGFMSTYKGRQLGTIGDFGCFSFHYTKNIICGEGGALSVNRNQKAAGRSMVMWEKGTNRYSVQ
jgi:dTDP-4-amino-4,6-dideoxygalactose transaminase